MYVKQSLLWFPYLMCILVSLGSIWPELESIFPPAENCVVIFHQDEQYFFDATIQVEFCHSVHQHSRTFSVIHELWEAPEIFEENKAQLSRRRVFCRKFLLLPLVCKSNKFIYIEVGTRECSTITENRKKYSQMQKTGWTVCCSAFCEITRVVLNSHLCRSRGRTTFVDPRRVEKLETLNILYTGM